MEETTLAEQIVSSVRAIWKLGRLGADQNVNRSYRLTPEQYEMLRFLYDSGPHSVKLIARHVGTTSSPVTISVKRLERANLVKKIRSKSDERVVTVHLTDHGRRAFEARREERLRVLSYLFDSLDIREKHQLNSLLQKVLSNSRVIGAEPRDTLKERS